MKKLTIIFIFSILLLTPIHTYAIVDPLKVPNNKYGIHAVDENDLENAAALVNSSNGDWGYVTMVIREDDRNLQKWSGIFVKLNKLHLIPIIRLATVMTNNSWVTPDIRQAPVWADFLDNLPWPTQNRYIILFNEPNHAKEWGGDIDPEGYSHILMKFSLMLKNKSTDFFILPAGLDASANNSSVTMDEVLFIKKMLLKNPKIFNYLDGWTSHAYPNPHFRGLVNDTGRGTLQTFRWETELLKSLGITEKFPIFITETGWPHSEGNLSYNYYSADQVSEMILNASNSVWLDENIVAVTPFIINYQSDPFINFSWQKPNSSLFYPQYDTYRSIAKVQGLPDLNDSNRYLTQETNHNNPEISDKADSLGLLNRIIVKIKNNKLLSFLFNIKNLSDFISRT